MTTLKDQQEKKFNDDKLQLEQQKLLIEEKKITLEERKFTLEKEKFVLEEKKLAALILLEDLKAHWQRLLNYESENNRWISIYISALVFGLGWLISNQNYHNFQELFGNEKNSYLLLSISLVNSIYTLSLAIRAYWIKSLEVFLQKKIGKEISGAAAVGLDIWSKKKNKVKIFYYAIRGCLPAAVSLVILYFDLRCRYYDFCPDSPPGRSNIYFYVVASLVSLCLILSLWTVLYQGERSNSKDSQGY